jgi:hypothetical protein
MKALRSIRRGVKEPTDAITANTFGNDFKGGALCGAASSTFCRLI